MEWFSPRSNRLQWFWYIDFPIRKDLPVVLQKDAKQKTSRLLICPENQAPLSPMASTGQPSLASLQRASSSGVVGCL